MKAIRQYRFGGPEELVYEEVPDPSPAAGQVRIAVQSSGVHLVDTTIRAGHELRRAAPADTPDDARAVRSPASSTASAPARTAAGSAGASWCTSVRPAAATQPRRSPPRPTCSPCPTTSAPTMPWPWSAPGERRWGSSRSLLREPATLPWSPPPQAASARCSSKPSSQSAPPWSPPPAAPPRSPSLERTVSAPTQ